MIEHSTQYDVILDAREDRCPMPLLKVKLALSKMQAGQILSMTTCDSGSLKDIPQYLEMQGYSLLSLSNDKNEFCFIIQKDSIEALC
ncbi:sulfurtransferase TusA family protein [Marinomonas posidonica]|uniref:SirA-like domain-containing protein n=1 Tax=Marinomonas posidonica (strain CECT 7376 / NCIMB 14433 / IVIA-Po-181) TaxID=491952 RepID=F6CRT3_MARPP|nr:sulfurtransferase TusA family protein [Marinomonas posidonica]AEF54936.1 SirA-like domain-containing protein [Marinomonas posidonica IVIA-Po-181]